MSVEQQAFIRAILDAPEDDAPRLIFADWLDEHGECERAEFIRVQIELARTPGCDSEPRCEQLNAALPNYVPQGWCHNCIVRGRLQLRERDLWIDGLLKTVKPLLPDDAIVHRHEDRPDYTPRTPEAYARRGFVESITCTAADWLAHGDAICESHPIREVRLTDNPNKEQRAAFGRVVYTLDDNSIQSQRWPGIVFRLAERHRISGRRATAYVNRGTIEWPDWEPISLSDLAR